MAELLIARPGRELDRAHLEKRAARPENATLAELLALQDKRAS